MPALTYDEAEARVKSGRSVQMIVNDRKVNVNHPSKMPTRAEWAKGKGDETESKTLEQLYAELDAIQAQIDILENEEVEKEVASGEEPEAAQAKVAAKRPAGRPKKETKAQEAKRLAAEKDAEDDEDDEDPDDDDNDD